MDELVLLEKAIGIAVDAHRGQKDKYGAPMILHPLRVMARVESPTAKIVAVLHDVVEDTDWTLEKLRNEGFPEPIVTAIDHLSKREGEEYARFVERSGANSLARVVKLADLQDNMDIRRIPQIDEHDVQRLQKYLTAWKSLTKS